MRTFPILVLTALFLSQSAFHPVWANDSSPYVPVPGGVGKIARHLEESGADTSKTCLDEFFKRRRELILKTSLGTAGLLGTPAGAFVGGVTAAEIAALLTGPGSWAVLGYGALGVYGGAIVGAATFLTAETIGLVRLGLLTREIHVIYEARVGSGEHLEGFLKRFHKKAAESRATDGEIIATLAALDESGALCDGSLVPAKRLKKGKKLRQRLTTESEIIAAIARTAVSADDAESDDHSTEQ